MAHDEQIGMETLHIVAHLSDNFFATFVQGANIARMQDLDESVAMTGLIQPGASRPHFSSAGTVSARDMKNVCLSAIDSMLLIREGMRALEREGKPIPDALLASDKTLGDGIRAVLGVLGLDYRSTVEYVQERRRSFDEIGEGDVPPAYPAGYIEQE